VAQVPLSLGLVHQAGAFVVLAIAVYHLHGLSSARQRVGAETARATG
jgi:heme A synthase